MTGYELYTQGFKEAAEWHREQLQNLITCTAAVLAACEFEGARIALQEQMKVYEMLIDLSEGAEQTFIENLSRQSKGVLYDA
jgi:hypothetical protein